MKTALYFVFILFMEFICGFILAVVYWFLSTLFIDKDGFGRSRINELIYYLVILLPPFGYCWMEHIRFKKEGHEKNSLIYQSAGITYLAGNFIFLLILTDFHLIRS
jgi:hypothetical protein